MNLYLTYPVTEKLTVGFGMFSYFGLSEDYGNNWVGRYYVQKAHAAGPDPDAGGEFQGERLALGRRRVERDVRLSGRQCGGPTTRAAGDGQMKIKDSVGFRRQCRHHDLAAAGHAHRRQLSFGGQAELQRQAQFQRPRTDTRCLLANPPQLNLGMTVPQSVMVGIYQELNAQWAVMADVGWQNWSQFGEVAIGVDSATPAVPRTLPPNCTSMTPGMERLAPNTRPPSNGGSPAASRMTPRPSAMRTAPWSCPWAQAYRFGLGAFWKVSHSVDLGAAYEFVWSGDLPVTQYARPYRGTGVGLLQQRLFHVLQRQPELAFLRIYPGAA